MELKSAIEFRSKGAALSKARTEGFGHIFFGNCTTLSTRIRCDVRLLLLYYCSLNAVIFDRSCES